MKSIVLTRGSMLYNQGKLIKLNLTLEGIIMFKTILKIFFISLLGIILVSGATYGFIHLGIPLQDTVVMGQDKILFIPDNLEDESTNIKVMSYNIRLIANEDINEHYWTNRKEHMIDLLDYYDADIIGFQEVTHPQYNYLIDQIGDEYNYYGIYRSGLNRERGDMIISNPDPKPTLLNMLRIAIVDEGSPIFYRKSRFELLDYDTFWLRENPEKPGRGWDANIRRVCSYVKLRDHYTDEIITVYNTHFDHRGDLARQNSADLIYEYIEQSQGTHIAMGDFNVPEGGEVYNSIVSRSLSDAKFLSPEDKRDSGPTFNGFGRYSRAVPIDYIFIDNNAFNVLSYRIITDKYADNYYISDHYPVLVELEYK